MKDICALSVDIWLRSQLGTVGALVDHLIRERAVGDLSDDGVEVRGIELLTLCVLSILLQRPRFLNCSNLQRPSHAYKLGCAAVRAETWMGMPG